MKTSVTGYGVSSNDGMNFRFEGLFKRSPSTWAPLNFIFTSRSNRCDGRLSDLSWARYWNPSVYAGASDGAAGYADGAGGTARFAYPMSAAPAPGGSSLWIVDRDNHCIRSLTENGVAGTVLGSPGVAGFAQGSAANLRLNAPTDIELLSNGDYVTESRTIRKITPRVVWSALSRVVQTSRGSSMAVPWPGPFPTRMAGATTNSR